MSSATRLLSVVFALSLALTMGACTKKSQKPEGAGPEVTNADISSDLADSDSGKAMGLQTVHYAYDSSTLDGEAKKTLKANAEVLKGNGSVKVQIEGHTDDRGGIQYNIALGERRANSAKAFLVDQGVGADRLTTISYGKERPIEQGSNDAAWAKNRRANFRITEK